MFTCAKILNWYIASFLKNEATTYYADILRRFLRTKRQHIILIYSVVSIHMWNLWKMHNNREVSFNIIQGSMHWHVAKYSINRHAYIPRSANVHWTFQMSIGSNGPLDILPGIRSFRPQVVSPPVVSPPSRFVPSRFAPKLASELSLTN